MHSLFFLFFKIDRKINTLLYNFYTNLCSHLSANFVKVSPECFRIFIPKSNLAGIPITKFTINENNVPPAQLRRTPLSRKGILAVVPRHTGGGSPNKDETGLSALAC